MCRKKLIEIETDKNYPRTTMSQQQLTGLAVIVIECEVINDLDMSELT
jgi:hypothetical protein